MIRNKNTFIYLHPSIWFTIIVSLLTGMLTEVLIIFTIVIWHELGHIIVAKLFNWNIRRVTLWIFGGVMETEEHGNKPAFEQFFITIAGPLQHVFIYWVLLQFNTTLQLSESLTLFAIKYNQFILLFNLIPIWPLDGGKLFNLLLNKIYPYKKAYERTLIFSFAMLFLFLVIVTIYYDAFLNASVLFTFLILENRLEWKRRLYVFQRFLLSRMSKMKQSRKVVPLILSSQTSLSDVFLHFRANCYHPILIKERCTLTNESTCLKHYFEQGNYQDRLDDVIRN
ncbi:site-2 protease family protein [Amphibacillus cookii]|uniref:site-2 protease family protein n=1 Tax=Amphibacillus cookii TaxID=767787 RepID=UPI001958B178|nr:site-2 protease family protein [Amphibacillus cookii]MBM7541776.1 stage IV sporulation protein FB [Amphibacillus cookii]